MKPILAALLITASGAFAEDVFLYDMTSGGGRPSLHDYVTSLRYRIKQSLEVMEAHHYDINLLQNNPDIQEMVESLQRWHGFTSEHIAREFQIAAAEYRKEKAEREELQRESARSKAALRRSIFEWNEYTGNVKVRRAIPVGSEPEGDAHEEYNE